MTVATWCSVKEREKKAEIYHTLALPEFSKYQNHSYTEWTHRFMNLTGLFPFSHMQGIKQWKSDIKVKALTILKKMKWKVTSDTGTFSPSSDVCSASKPITRATLARLHTKYIFFQVKENCFKNTTKRILSCLHVFCTDYWGQELFDVLFTGEFCLFGFF